MRRRRPDPPTVPPNGESTGIDSLQRGLELLRSFQPGADTLSIGEAAARIGLARGTAERLLATLAAQGFLQAVPDSDRYRPDVGCLVLGQSVLSSLPALRTARPILQALADRCSAHVSLAVRERHEMLCLLHCSGAGARALTLGAGSLLPIGVTAVGRAWLWAQSPTVQGETIQRLRAGDAERGARLAAGIYRAFQEIEEGGVCYSFGEWQRDVSAAGTPLIAGQQPNMALSCKVVGLDRGPEHLRNEIGPALIAAASDLKDALLRAGDLPRPGLEA